MSDISKYVNEKGQIEHESITSKAASIIRYKIIKGEFSQNERIRETDISNTLGISRLSIREAFLILEQEGLLVKEKNKYTKIIDFSEQDIIEIYSLRTVIECMCAGILIKKGNIPEKEIWKVVSALEKIANKNPIDELKWLDYDLAFHEAIVVNSGHTRAMNIWNNLKNQIKVLLYPVIKETSLIISTSSEESHANMFETMLKGNEAKFTFLLDKHISGGAQHVITHLRNQK